VHRSQGDRKFPHHAWFLAKKDGVVEAAHCTCMAGLGEVCSHVGGIMFAAEFYVRKEEENAASCTSKANSWLAPNVPSEDDVLINELKHVRNI